MSNVLVIDDDKDVLMVIKRYLEKQGCFVFCATTGEKGIQILLKETIDCIVLDVLLENENGFDICRQIKKITAIPIIFLTNLGNEDDLKIGFLSGGDDYITKPFSMMELYLRIQARIRQYHHSGVQQETLSFAPLLINLNARVVTVSGIKITLTASEFDILVLLANSPQTIFAISEIYQAVWKMPDMDNAHTVQVHIANLRKKMDAAYPAHHFVQTVWGKGYQFSPISI